MAMEPERIEVTLLPGPDDPPVRDTVYQRELRELEDSFRQHGIKAGSLVELRKSAGGESVHLGQFFLPLVATLGSIAGAAIGAWVQAKYGRRVRVKMGDIEVEARTIEEVQDLLKRAQKLHQKEPRIIP